jgi:hypothetical protein
MRELIVDPFLLEVAIAIDNRCYKNRAPKSTNLVHRVVASLNALKVWGMAEVDYEAETSRWIASRSAVKSMQLTEFHCSGQAIQAALWPPFHYLLKTDPAWCSADDQLTHEVGRAVSSAEVRKMWRYVGTMIGGIAEGDVRHLGAGVSGGLFFEVGSNPGNDAETVRFSLVPISVIDDEPAIIGFDQPDDIKNATVAHETLIFWPIRSD